MGKMAPRVMVYIWHLDSIKSIAIDFLDTVQVLKMKALGYSEPEDAAFYVVEIVYLKEHSRCRLLSDQSRLIEAILHDESISLSKAILVIRDFRHAISDSIYSAAINGNGSTTTSLTPAVPIANQVNNGIVSLRGNQGKAMECEPWTSHPNGCTEWIYSPYNITSYSAYNHVAHYKLELFEDRLFQAICDASSKQGQLQRSLRSNGVWRDGYFCYYKRALWFHNTIATNTLGVVNNVSSAQTMESSADGFAVNFTAGKTEESVYLAVTDENPKKCRSWLSAINTGAMDDETSQSILNADITIAAMELTNSERSVQRTCKLGDINTAIEITYVRRLFQQYLAGKKIGNLLPAFEVMEDFRRSYEKNREKALNRATVIYKAFLSSSASDPIDIHSEPIGPVVDLLVDGKCEADMFTQVLMEVAKKLSHQFYHGFLPEYRDQLTLIESLYPSFHDLSATRSKVDTTNQSSTGTPSKSAISAQAPTTSPTNSGTSSNGNSSSSTGSRFWSRPIFNKFMPRFNTSSDATTTSSTSSTTDSDMNSQFESTALPTSPTTPKQTTDSNFLFSSWSTSNVLISRAGESWWQNYSRDKSRHIMPTIGLKNTAEQGISNQFAPDIPSQVLSWAFQQSFQHIWDFSDSNAQKGSEGSEGSDDDQGNEYETSNNNIEDANNSANDNDEDEDNDATNAIGMQDISELFGMGCIKKIGHVYAKYFRSKTKGPMTFTLGSGDDPIGGNSAGLALNGALGNSSNTNNIGNNNSTNNTATHFEEVSRERWPSEDFISGAGSSVNDGRPVTAMLTLMPSQRLGRLMLLENDKIIVRIHLKNCVKIVFAHDDPTSIVIEDEIGAKWHLQPEGSDDIDCFEQARSWHHCITACMPGHITRESVEAMGYFLKRGKINTSLRKRWFMLISDTRNHWKLRYYKDENNLVYKGEINLSIVDTVECSQSGESENTSSNSSTPSGGGSNQNSNSNNSSSQGVMASSSGANNAPSTATSVSATSRFRILRGTQSRTIKLISKHRTWELMTDSQSQADYWFPLLRQVVSISGNVAFNENDFFDEEGDDEGEDYD